jgi:ribosomal protein S18 acetylase RimI-like enzyme
MKIRPYSHADHQACVEILTSNVPDFFLATDVTSFFAFVARLPGPYYVLEDLGQTVAAGGWALDGDGVADLTWAMVRRDLHRRGFGSELLRFRLKAICKETQASLVRVRTTQLVLGFFSRHGFRVVDVVVDGYGAGQDLVTMELNLPPN